MPYYTDVKCLIFSNPTANASIDTMTLDMAAAMRQLGINARVFLTSGETMNMEFVGVLLREIQMHTGRSFIVDVNGRYDIGTGDSNFFDQMGVPKFSFMTDNPSALTPKLRGIPKNFLCGMVQNEHLEHCEAYGLDAARAIFFPHGGPVPLANQRPSAERDIDILFAGNVQTVPDFKTWLKTKFPKSDQLREVLLGIEQRLYATNAQPFSTVLGALKAAGIEITPALLAQMYTPLERFLINRERTNVLSAIQKHSLTVIGDISKEIIEANPQHKFLGPRTYGEVMDSMARQGMAEHCSHV